MKIPRSIRAGALSLGVVLAWPASAVVAADTDTAGTGASPSGAVDLLPDMVMSALETFYLQDTASGAVRLRFGTVGWNVGAGPLEALGTRPTSADRYMTVRQKIYDSMGGSRTRRTSAVMYHDGADGHSHYHIRQFIHVELYRLGEGDGDVYGLRKMGFCLLDSRRQTNPPPGAPASAQYVSCGNQNSSQLRMGLSVGWGDWYPANYAHQFLVVTGIPVARYRICATVDPFDEFAEADETNNQRWTDVRINVATNTVNFKAHGVGPCGPSIPV